MAYDPHPGVPAPNTLADAAKMRAQLDALFEPPHAKASSSTTVSYPSTACAVSFDTEDFDNDGMYSAGSPKRLTIQTAGLYLVQGHLWQVGTLHTSTGLALRKNGTDGSTTGELASASFGTGSGTSMLDRGTTGVIVRLSAADYIELVVYHGSTSNQMNFRWLSAVLLSQ